MCACVCPFESRVSPGHCEDNGVSSWCPLQALPLCLSPCAQSLLFLSRACYTSVEIACLLIFHFPIASEDLYLFIPLTSGSEVMGERSYKFVFSTLNFHRSPEDFFM